MVCQVDFVYPKYGIDFAHTKAIAYVDGIRMRSKGVLHLILQTSGWWMGRDREVEAREDGDREG